MLRLTTTGRRSGEPRAVLIGYYEDGRDLVSMAMNGWGAAEPAWWLNLQTHPEAVVDLAGGRRLEVVGRAAVGGERESLWQRWREIDRNLDGYASRRPRETAVVVLEPRAFRTTDRPSSTTGPVPVARAYASSTPGNVHAPARTSGRGR